MIDITARTIHIIKDFKLLSRLHAHHAIASDLEVFLSGTGLLQKILNVKAWPLIANAKQKTARAEMALNMNGQIVAATVRVTKGVGQRLAEDAALADELKAQVANPWRRGLQDLSFGDIKPIIAVAIRAVGRKGMVFGNELPIQKNGFRLDLREGSLKGAYDEHFFLGVEDFVDKTLGRHCPAIMACASAFSS